MTRRPEVVSVWTSHASAQWNTVLLDNDDRESFKTHEEVDLFCARFGIRVLWGDWTDGIAVRWYALAPIDAEVPA